MGFKADTSFLRFLTMGAKGVHQTMTQLKGMGFQPIELERYCSSNKIWATKIKRLRLPDVLCVNTGLRIEVRAKTDLKIKVSDAPGNPDRVWDAGLGDGDLIAFITCFDTPDGPVPAEEAQFFTVEDLRKSVHLSKLGPPKSASEGAERDRTWPSTVPTRSGRVVDITETGICVEMTAMEGRPARRQTYPLKEKSAYVRVGDQIKASASFLSGVPAKLADVRSYLSRRYDPLSATRSANPVDRYAAVKALRYRHDNPSIIKPVLERVIATEQDSRVKLEAAGAAAFYGFTSGQMTIEEYLWTEKYAREFKMEAVLILTELTHEKFAIDLLKTVAAHESFANDEIRQAAVWGLGKAGAKAYAELLPFLHDGEDDVVLHAISALGTDVPGSVVQSLIGKLAEGDERIAPAVSEALREIASAEVVKALVHAHDHMPVMRNWVLATLGGMPPPLIRRELAGLDLLRILEPMLLIGPGANWLRSEEMEINIAFLRKQNVYV